MPGGARGGALRRAARVGVGLGATGRATSPRLASGMGDGRGAGASSRLGRDGRWPSDPRKRHAAVVQTVDGALYHVSDRPSVTLAAGRPILDSQEIRTANSSSAVIRLADDSSIEMSQRTGLWVSRGWRGTTIHLERGKIIVRAASSATGGSMLPRAIA